MIFYSLAALFSQLAIAFIWFVIVVVGQNNVDVRGIGIFLAVLSGIPLIIHCFANIAICRWLRNLPFIKVFLVSVCSYFGEFAIFLEIFKSPNGEYFDQGVVAFFLISLIPMTSNLLLFWFIGIRNSDFFEGCKIQLAWVRKKNNRVLI